MVSAARQIVPLQSVRGSPSEMLLMQLWEAHEQLIREMENLDRITLGPLPDAPVFTAARWHISQASLRRRTLSVRIADFLADRISEGDASCLEKLRSENQLAMSRSAKHIQAWTTQSIRQDWKGYCTASREIRMEMKANILLEKQTLYPILERLAGRGV